MIVAPHSSAPSQKRQIGARKNASCHASPSRVRLAEMPPRSHFSQPLRNSRGADSAMKSRFDGSFP